MGDTLKMLNNSMREIETEVTLMTESNGLYADTANTAAFKESEIYKDMAVKAPTVKSKLVSSIMRWFRVNVLTKMSTKIAEKYATKIYELEASVSDMNKIMTGSDSIAPKHEEMVRYEEMEKLTLSILHKHSKLETKIGVIDKAVEKNTLKMFDGLIDSDGDEVENEDDDESGSDKEGSSTAEVTVNVKAAEQVKMLKDAKKTMESEQRRMLTKYYTRISGGLYNSDEKSAPSKQNMPSGKVGSNGKTYIAKMLYFLESQPQKFGWCLHEMRRTLKDFNQRKGTHYNGKDASEVKDELRERYKTSNNALYKEFEISCSASDFAAAHRTYTYGTNGGSKSDPWPCAEGNGLRLLHFFVTRLVKVDCDHIESIEADLMECPSLFGLGQPADAVEKVNAFLDEAERVDAQVGYRVVLRICDVLSKRHPLFAGLHSEKIKPSALTERRNARPELIRLMDEISTILLNIGDNTQHWKANQVNVEVGIKTFHISKFVEANRTAGRGMQMRESEHQGEVSANNTSPNQAPPHTQPKRKLENASGSTDRVPCQYEGCDRHAFSHKKEHGGKVHASKMYFDHFLTAVEDSKQPKPVGIPVKGGKTMIAKRDEEKKWAYKIFNIRLKANDDLELIRRKTFLKRIEADDAKGLLQELHEHFKREESNVRINNLNLGRQFEDRFEQFEPESCGTFELPGLGDCCFETIPIFDVKRQRLGQSFPKFSLYSNERGSSDSN